jgi:four helix bundle protein
MRSVEDLDVFKLAHRLTLEVYKLTATFRKEEIYGLSAQMRRAATSVPANLVEGANRTSRAEYRNFVGIAKGSAGEIRYYLLLAMDLEYVSKLDAQRLRGEYARVIQMLTNLVKSLGR